MAQTGQKPTLREWQQPVNIWQISGFLVQEVHNGEAMNFPANPRKATDAVARLIEKSGADVDYLRISKLAYLADRKAIIERGVPIVGGNFYSMRRGPVNADVMTFVNCRNAPGWKEVISVRRGHALNLLKKPDYEALSESEIEVLDSVVAEHFNRGTEELVQWCHDHCPEYEEIFISRRLISVEKILEKSGKSPEQIKKTAALASELTELDALLT